MTFINKFKYLGEKSLIFGKYGLHLNELLRESCPPPFGPAVLFKFVPDELVRKNLAAPGKLLLRCSTIGTPHRYIPVGDLDRSLLMRSYGYASAGDQSTLFAIFPLNFVPFMQYTG
jgi:hypothetical protein